MSNAEGTQRLAQHLPPLWLCHGSTISFPQRCLNKSRQQLINMNKPATDGAMMVGCADLYSCSFQTPEDRTVHSSTPAKFPQLQTFAFPPHRVTCYNYYYSHCIFSPLSEIDKSELIQARHLQQLGYEALLKAFSSSSSRTSDSMCCHSKLRCRSFVVPLRGSLRLEMVRAYSAG